MCSATILVLRNHTAAPDPPWTFTCWTGITKRISTWVAIAEEMLCLVGTELCMIKHFQLIVSLSYKYGAIYREVMHTPKFDWCALMEARETNPMILQILTVFKESFPELIHKCPFQVKHQVLIQNLHFFFIHRESSLETPQSWRIRWHRFFLQATTFLTFFFTKRIQPIITHRSK